MERLNVDLADRSYPISIGSGLLGHRELFSHAICGRRVMVVSNETVAPLYLEQVRQRLDGYQVDTCILPDGEAYKTLDSFNQIMTALHLVNSMPGYIILMMGTDVITIYIFLQFFENLSSTLDESAILDGCTYFGVFFKILLPLLKPAIVTSAILKGVSTYNEYYMANLYLQDKTKYQVVATSLYVFSGPMGNQYNYICAGVIITIIPALIVFLLCQDQIYSGMAAGAVKG